MLGHFPGTSFSKKRFKPGLANLAMGVHAFAFNRAGMHSFDTVSGFMRRMAVANLLPASEKEARYDRIAPLPLCLDPMMAYDERAAILGVDIWNTNAQFFKERACTLLRGERYLLFAGKSGNCDLLLLGKGDLLRVIFDAYFCFPFALFSEDLSGYLIEDHSGLIVADGEFGPLLDRPFGA